MKVQKILVIVLLLSIGVSCVPKKEYDDLLSRKLELSKEVQELRKRDKDCKELEKTYAETVAQRDQLLADLGKVEKALEQSKIAYDDLLGKYNTLLDQKNDILNRSSLEKEALASELSSKEMEIEQQMATLRDLQRELNRKEGDLVLMRSDLEDLEGELNAREARINALEDQLNAQNMVMNQLKEKISEALLGFSETDLSVRQEGGKVYVSMSQELLFAKGSDDIDALGKQAIRKLATVLKANPDIAINVEGHTDSDGTPNLNWDLSVTRATAVVKVLTVEGVDPERITASGRGLYDPIAPNDIEANKTKNRRTEIILSPKLDELYRLING
jgi:chemotaxis protein MotB